MSVELDLSAYDENWAGLPEGDDFDEVPPGIYQCEVETIKLDVTKGENNKPKQPILKWGLRILDGQQCIGRMIFRNNLFGTVENLKFLRKDLAKVGVSIVKLNELKDKMEDIQGVCVEVKVVHKPNPGDPDKPFRNAYIQKAIEMTPEMMRNKAGISDEDEVVEDGDLPF